MKIWFQFVIILISNYSKSSLFLIRNYSAFFHSYHGSENNNNFESDGELDSFFAVNKFKLSLNACNANENIPHYGPDKHKLNENYFYEIPGNFGADINNFERSGNDPFFKPSISTYLLKRISFN